jgi:rhodanese-related sulfurtransferase
MKAINRYFAIVLVALLAVGARAWAADAPAAKEDWYRNIVDLNYVKSRADLPLPGDVVLVDSRPVRKFDEGHIPGSINLPDTQFDKLVDRLPAEKGKELIFYCGGTECMLSHNSAKKAEALGYTNVKVYAAGYPDWQKQAGACGAAIKAGKSQGSISIESFEQIVKEKPDGVLLVDVRDAKEFGRGTVKGAVNIPIGDLEKKIATLPTDKPIVFICGTGARSGEAYDMVKLVRPELKQVYFLDAELKFNGDGSFKVSKG